MVEKADMLIAVYDGKPGGTAKTIEMASKKNIPIKIINPSKILQNDDCRVDNIQTTLI
jgi:hypothetical protein